MQVVVNKLLVNYEIQGQGRPLLLLHGWADSLKSFEQFSNSLSKQYQVIRLDLPGFGGSQAPQETWDLNDYAAFTRDFLKKKRIGNIYGLIGHSNGGAVAIRAIAEGQVEAAKLVLMASAGIRNVNKGRNRALAIITKTGKVISKPLPAASKQRLRRRLYRGIGSDMLVAPHLQETFKRVVGDDVSNDARKLDLPVLLIYGEADTATPVWYGEKFHQLMSNSTLEILPGAGHFVFIDRPDQVTKLVEGFLK